MSRTCRQAPVATALGVCTAFVHAAPVTHFGVDHNVSSPNQMTQSKAAAALFDAAVTPNLFTFNGALPAGVTYSRGTVKGVSACGMACGFNTTSGGGHFLELWGGVTTFDFTDGIDAFGLFITGLQSEVAPQQWMVLTYADLSTETIQLPQARFAGGMFAGFTDVGRKVISVSIDVGNDIVALDDLR